MIDLKTRCYWGSRNLLAFIFIIILSPIIVIVGTFQLIKTACVTDGSSLLLFPWEDGFWLGND